MICHILGKHHVNTPVLEAVRIVIGKIKGGRKAFLKARRTERRILIAATIQTLKRNLWEYRYVMGTVPRKYPPFQNRYWFDTEDRSILIGPVAPIILDRHILGAEVYIDKVGNEWLREEDALIPNE